MGQHYDPDDLDHEELDDDLGRPIYHGSGLSVRELTAEELQRFLDAHASQPAQRLGSGWAALDPPGRPMGFPGPLRGPSLSPRNPAVGPGRRQSGPPRPLRPARVPAAARA